MSIAVEEQNGGWWVPLDAWVEESRTRRWFELSRPSSSRARVRLFEATGPSSGSPDDDCVADCESATLEGAVDGAVRLARLMRASEQAVTGVAVNQ